MTTLLRGPRIALMEFYGTIGGSIRPWVYLPLLERVRRSNRYRGLVLAIDSPGGAAAASEELYQGVSGVAQAKPVVVCIRERGASGAYYISCAAHKIVAVPNSLVGSIGVIFARPVAEDLLQKLGLAFSVHKSGKHKDMFFPWRWPTPEEETKSQALADEVYERFIQVVAQGRKLDPAQVRELATGEVFTAQRARENGLVDELGDLDSAVEMAASMADIKRRVVQIRPRRPLLSRVWGDVMEDAARTLVAEMENRMTGRLWM